MGMIAAFEPDPDGQRTIAVFPFLTKARPPVWKLVQADRSGL